LDIIVCIKQVPDISKVQKIKTDSKTRTIVREGIPSVVNPYDMHAVEEAVRIKERLEEDVTITVITMGPPQAEEALLKCLSMGADRAILLSDREFAGGDTLATGYVLSEAIKRIGKYDLIFCGLQAIDGDTAQIGPGIAENLHIPQITYTHKLEIRKNKVLATREVESGMEVIESRMPVLVTVLKTINEPRIPTYKGITSALAKEITVWGMAELNLEKDRIGLSGSPTTVVTVFSPEPRGGGQKFQGLSVGEAVDKILNVLREENFV
jgi:electron transfer flavoprotein alpha/beta subunit